MNITKLLLLAVFLECITVNNIFSMKRDHELALEEFEENQSKLSEQYFWNKIDWKTLDEHVNTLFIQAIQSGIAPSTPIRLVWVSDSKRDIMAYALEKKNQKIVECCFEHDYSPDNLVLYGDKKIPALSIASPDLWPLFKKYNANFNILFLDGFEEYKTTVLHKSFLDKPKSIKWLCKETTIDINQPDGNGDTVGHYLANLFYFNKKKGEKIFTILKNNHINPFQKNNENQTPKEAAEHMARWYQKEFSINSNNYDAQEYLSNALTLLFLWKNYESEYLHNNAHEHNKKLCYCEKFIKPNKKDILIKSDYSSEQIINTYNFFPIDSLIGSLCKKNPNNSDCIIIAQHYISFNDFHLLIEKKENLLQQEKALEKEKDIILEQIRAAREKQQTLSQEDRMALLSPEIQIQYAIHKQLPSQELMELIKIVRNAEEQYLGITNLRNQQNTIEKQLHQIKTEFFSVAKQAKKKHKKNQGYYSALDFNICLGKSSYHLAVKNLLAMIPDNLQYIEAAKINEGLHNAYHNKKQL